MPTTMQRFQLFGPDDEDINSLLGAGTVTSGAPDVVVYKDALVEDALLTDLRIEYRKAGWAYVGETP